MNFDCSSTLATKTQSREEIESERLSLLKT